MTRSILYTTPFTSTVHTPLGRQSSVGYHTTHHDLNHPYNRRPNSGAPTFYCIALDTPPIMRCSCTSPLSIPYTLQRIAHKGPYLEVHTDGVQRRKIFLAWRALHCVCMTPTFFGGGHDLFRPPTWRNGMTVLLVTAYRPGVTIPRAFPIAKESPTKEAKHMALLTTNYS